MNVINNTESRRLRLDIFLYASLGMWFVVLSAVGIFVLAKNLDEVETIEQGSAVVWLPANEPEFSYGKVQDDSFTDDQIDQIQRTIAAQLDNNPLVKEFRYIDKDESQAQLEQYFVESPEIIDLIGSTNMAPTSFVVTPQNEASVQDFGNFLNGLPNIDKVSVEPSEVTQSENWPLIGALALPLSALIVLWLGFFVLKPQES